MNKIHPVVSIITLLLPLTSMAGQSENYDYFCNNRTLIQHGVQAVLSCNGLFTSQRNLERVFEQELAYLKQPLGTAEGGEYVVNQKRRSVTVGGQDSGTRITAAFREGIGCVIMAPDQNEEDIDRLPEIRLAPWSIGRIKAV